MQEGARKRRRSLIYVKKKFKSKAPQVQPNSNSKTLPHSVFLCHLSIAIPTVSTVLLWPQTQDPTGRTKAAASIAQPSMRAHHSNSNLPLIS